MLAGEVNAPRKGLLAKASRKQCTTRAVSRSKQQPIKHTDENKHAHISVAARAAVGEAESGTKADSGIKAESGIKAAVAPKGLGNSQVKAKISETVFETWSRIQNMNKADKETLSSLLKDLYGDQQEDEYIVSTVPTGEVWEIDFCSRPLLDAKGKKVWELVMCDPLRNFEYVQEFSNSKVNSTELIKCIKGILAQEGAETPIKVRFFRSQMQTIIRKAFDELGITAIASRRTPSLYQLLEERYEQYTQDPRYSAKSKTLFAYEPKPPEDLPKYMIGDGWYYSQITVQHMLDNVQDIEEGEIFGEMLELEAIGLGGIDPNTVVPGLAVISHRAGALAGSHASLEMYRLSVDTAASRILLETGANTTWKYAPYKKTPESTKVAQYWEQTKKNSSGLHFLAITDKDGDCEGFWLMQDKKLNF